MTFAAFVSVSYLIIYIPLHTYNNNKYVLKQSYIFLDYMFLNEPRLAFNINIVVNNN